MTDSELGFLGLMRKAGALAIGAEDVYDAARMGKARLLLLAEDAAKNTVDGLRNALGEREIPLLRSGESKARLGAAVGVGECAAVAVLDTGFALALCRRLEEEQATEHLRLRLEREKKRKEKKLRKKEPQSSPKGVAKGGAHKRPAVKVAAPRRKSAGKGAGKAERGKTRVTGKRGN